MVFNLWNSRELILRLVQRDLSVRYRQSILGYVWAVIPQIVTVGIFVYISKSRLIDTGTTDMPYVLHVLWGLTIWQLFTSCLVAATNSLVNAGSLVTKVNFCKETLVIATIGPALFDFAIRLTLVVLVMIFMGFVPSLSALYLPFILMSVLILAIGLGFFFAIINLIFRDMGSILNVILTFGIFLAPIVYATPNADDASLLFYLNPFSPILITSQHMLIGAQLSFLNAYLIVNVIAVMIFVMGWRTFHLTIPRVTERA